MIEGIIQIGSALSSEENSLANLIEGLKINNKDKPLNVLKMNFDLGNNRLLLDTKEEMDEETANKYNFIGSGASRAAQWYASSKNLNYFLSETIYNLSEIDFEDEINKNIKLILEEFFVELDIDIDKKYKYLLDLKKLGLSNKSIEEIYEECKDEPKVGQKILNLLSKEIDNYLKETTGQGLKGIGLFNLQINGVSLSLNQSYIKRVLESKKPVQSTSDRGICSICEIEEGLTSDFTKTKIKLFTTNQNIFASNFNSKKYDKNMQFCGTCFLELLGGENFIMKNLSTRLAELPLYIIPQFIYGEPIDESSLVDISKNIINSFNTVKSYDSISKFKENISMDLSYTNKESYFLLNFLFYKKAQASTKVQTLVKDVNPSIFDKISTALLVANDSIIKIIGSVFKNHLTLNTVYYMHPIKLSDGNPVQFRDVLQTYDHILSCKKLNKNHIIKNIIECVKIMRFQKPSYNININNSIEFYIMQSNIYLRFLEEMNCIKEGRCMDVDKLMINEEKKTFIREMKYDEEQSALFLMGTLIGAIGNSQYNSASDNKNKPILNKINWNGVDKNKLIRLTKDVFLKLNQEKIRHFHEVTFGEMKRLLDKNMDSWSRNKDENLFYILSGYSYETTKAILKGAKKNEE